MALTVRQPHRLRPRPRKLLSLKRKLPKRRLLKQPRPTQRLPKLQDQQSNQRHQSHPNLTQLPRVRPRRKPSNRNPRKRWPAKPLGLRKAPPHRTQPKSASPDKKAKPPQPLRRQSLTAPPVSKSYAAANRARWFARLPRNTALISAGSKAPA